MKSSTNTSTYLVGVRWDGRQGSRSFGTGILMECGRGGGMGVGLALGVAVGDWLGAEWLEAAGHVE